MTNEIWITLLGLGLASFAIRLGGFLLAGRLPQTGRWARGMEALPGCLIMALVTLMMVRGSVVEWVAGVMALLVAAKTRNLLLCMLTGMIAVAVLRLVLPV